MHPMELRKPDSNNNDDIEQSGSTSKSIVKSNSIFLNKQCRHFRVKRLSHPAINLSEIRGSFSGYHCSPPKCFDESNVDLIVVHLKSYCTFDGCTKLISDLRCKFKLPFKYCILVDCEDAKMADLNVLYAVNSVLCKHTSHVKCVVIYNLPNYLQLMSRVLSSFFNNRHCELMKFATSSVDVFEIIPFELAINHFQQRDCPRVHRLPSSHYYADWTRIKQDLVHTDLIKDTFSIFKLLFVNC